MAGEVANFRRWDELLPDALGLIFHKLTLQEKLTVVPRVCKSWGEVVKGPYCWQDIDITEWCEQSESNNIDRMIRLLIERSGGSTLKLCVSGLKNDSIFTFIGEHAGSLETLGLPRSHMSDAIIEQIAGNLSSITTLDLSYCSMVGAPSLLAIGKHCKSLTALRRTMHPINIEDRVSQDDEGLAIATTMPKLKQLEMAYLLVSTATVLEIIRGCPELEFLDLRGCWDVNLDEKYLKEKFPKLKILGPHVVDLFASSQWEVCSDFSDSLYDSEDGTEGMWDEEDEMWEEEESLQLVFYEGLMEESGYGWPPSP